MIIIPSRIGVDSATYRTKTFRIPYSHVAAMSIAIFTGGRHSLRRSRSDALHSGRFEGALSSPVDAKVADIHSIERKLPHCVIEGRDPIAAAIVLMDGGSG